MLQNRARASRLRRDALYLLPFVARVSGFVNSAACRGDNVIRVMRIDVDCEDVRVVNDSVLDTMPGLPAIHAFERQVPRSCVDDVRVARIDRYRLNIYQARCAARRQCRPGLSRVCRTIDATDGTRQKGVWIRL